MTQLPLNDLPVILDRAVQRQDDRFGHIDFADALNLLIKNQNNIPPFSIGLLGQWGTGKSSIEEMSIEELGKDKRFKIIQFNAWRYGGENIKRALLREVFLELSDSREQGQTKLNDAIKTEFSFSGVAPPQVGKELWALLIRAGGLLLITVILTAVLALAWASLVSLFQGTKWLSAVADSLTKAPVVTISVLGTIALAVFTQLRFMLPPYETMTRKETAKSVEETIESSLEALIHKRLTASGERIVIFVDDLDRLSAEEMVNGLDAIRNFMDIKIGSRQPFAGLVFVISCDEERVAEALEKRRNRSSELPAVVLNAQDARRFLDRVFQYRLEIPPFPKQDMREFITSKLDVPVQQGGLLDLKASLEKFAITPQKVVDRLIQYDVTNPRAALQVINYFAQSWWIATKREGVHNGTRIGALLQGSVTQHAEVLAVLSALRVLHPTFYLQLQQTPDLLQNFISVFVAQDTVQARANFASLSPKHRQSLQPYLAKSDNNAEEAPVELDDKYTALMESIAWRITGLQMPDDLEPLLLLSQDVHQRQSSRSIRELEQSLVTSIPSFLAALNVQGSNPLTQGDVQNVGRLIEERISQRQMGVNYRRAYQNLTSPAFLSHLPSKGTEVTLVMDSLAQGLTSQQDLRHFVGPTSTIAVARLAANSYQRNLLGILTKEMLVESDKTVEFFQPDSKDPILTSDLSSSIDELVPLLMKGNITSNTRADFHSWLHRMNLGQEEEPMGIEHLQKWYQMKPDYFQGSPGRSYAKHVTNALANGWIGGVDDNGNNVTAAEIGQLSRIWTAELKGDDEQRLQVVHQLRQLLKSSEADAAVSAWQVWQDQDHVLRVQERQVLSDALGEHVNDAIEKTSTKEDTLRKAYLDWIEQEDRSNSPNAAPVKSVIGTLKTWATKPAASASLHRLAHHSLTFRKSQLENAVSTWMVDGEREAIIPEAFSFIGENIQVFKAEIIERVGELLQVNLKVNPPTELERMLPLIRSMSSADLAAHYEDAATAILNFIRTNYASNPQGYGAHSPQQVKELLPFIAAFTPAAPDAAQTLITNIVSLFGGSSPSVVDELLLELNRRDFEGMSSASGKAMFNHVAQRMQSVASVRNQLTQPLINLLRILEDDEDSLENAQSQLASLGRITWASDPDLAIAMMQAAGTQLGYSHILSLLNDIDVEDETNLAFLLETWQQLLQPHPELREPAIKNVFPLRGKANQKMPQLLTTLLGRNAQVLAEKLLPTVTGKDFEDLWRTVLQQPSDITSEWLAQQAATHLKNNHEVATLCAQQAALFTILSGPDKESLYTDLKQGAFDDSVTEPAAELALEWLVRENTRAVNNLNVFPKVVRERVRDLRTRLRTK